MEIISTFLPELHKEKSEKKPGHLRNQPQAARGLHRPSAPVTFEEEKRIEGVIANYFLIPTFFGNKDNKLHHRPFQMNKNMF